MQRPSLACACALFLTATSPPNIPPVPNRMKADGPYDSRMLPATLAVCLVASLSVVFSGAVVRLHSET